MHINPHFYNRIYSSLNLVHNLTILTTTSIYLFYKSTTCGSTYYIICTAESVSPTKQNRHRCWLVKWITQYFCLYYPPLVLSPELIVAGDKEKPGRIHKCSLTYLILSVCWRTGSPRDKVYFCCKDLSVETIIRVRGNPHNATLVGLVAKNAVCNLCIIVLVRTRRAPRAKMFQ